MFRGNELVRLGTMICMLIVMAMVIHRAADPDVWTWFAPGSTEMKRPKVALTGPKSEADSPAAEKSAAETPAATKPAAEKSAAEKSDGKKPDGKKSDGKAPPAGTPARRLRLSASPRWENWSRKGPPSTRPPRPRPRPGWLPPVPPTRMRRRDW